MGRHGLSAIVFVAGAAVLAIEILGTRILGPFYGVSLFLWSALITATLVALSAGYAIGGRFADRGPTFARLGIVLAAAGAWTLSIPWLRAPVLVLVEPLGLRTAVLVASVALFVPPLLLLGMVSPYAVRLRASGLSDVGRSAGDLYAISTLGSVLAALATGFFLVPQVGVRRLTLGIGFTLLVTGAITLASGRPWRTRAALGGAAAVALAAGLALAGTERTTSPGLVTVQQSPYAELRVLDHEGLRYLLIDGGTHTIIDRETGASRHPYAQVTELANLFFERPGEMLLIGLGGGGLARAFSARRWNVTAVEIDPVVVELAHEHFGLEPSDATLHVMDGRRFLRDTETLYDLVVLDAFGSSSIPFHLLSDEAFALVASRLRAGGILVLNLEVLGWRHPIVPAATATLERHFPEHLALPVNHRDRLGNLLLLASQRPLQPLREWHFDLTQEADRNRNFAWLRRFIPEPRDARVITDDGSPIDLWSEEINRFARRELHAYFASRGTSW